MSRIQQLWTQLVSAPSSTEEKAAVLEIKKWLIDCDGYMSLTVVDLKGHAIAYQDFNWETQEAKTIEGTFNSADKQFVGKDWVPKEKENVFLFFLE